MVVDELITLLGLEVDDRAEGEANRFGAALGKIKDMALVAGAAVAAFAGAVAAYAAQQAEAIDKAGKFADSIGISYERLQELEYAARRSGGSVEELRGDLDKLTKSMSSPVPGEYNQTLFQLGISARNADGSLRGADEVLTDIASRLEGMDKQRQVQFAEKLGLSPSSIKLIQNGKAGIADLTKEARRLGLVLDENAKTTAAQFQDSLLNARATVEGLGKSISIGLLPGMGKTLDRFTAWIGRNRQFIASKITQVVEGVGKAFEWVGEAIGFVVDAVGKLLPDVGDAEEGLDITRLVAIALTGAMVALAAAVVAATWPFLLAAAAIAAVVLIVEDLVAAIEGQPSLIGDWADAFAKAYPEITAAIKAVWTAFKDFFAWMQGPAGTMFEHWKNIGKAAIDFIVGYVKDLLKAINRILSGENPFEVILEFWTSIGKRLVDAATAVAKSLWQAIKTIIGSDDPWADLVGWFDDTVEALLTAAGDLAASMAKTVTGWIAGAWDGLLSGFDAVGEQIGKVAGKIVDGLTGMFSKAIDAIFADITGLASKAASKVTGAFSAVFGGGEDEAERDGASSDGPRQPAFVGGNVAPGETTDSLRARLMSAPIGASSVGVGPQAMSAAGASSQDNRQTTININGAGDPAAVGREVVRQGGLAQTLQTSRPGATAPVMG